MIHIMKSCITCIWVGCREYGKDAGPCIAYVMSMEEERRIKDNKKQYERIKKTK